MTAWALGVVVTTAEGGAASRVRSAQFRWFVGASAFSMVGNAMTDMAIYWLAVHLAGGRALDVSLVAVALCLPVLLFSRWAGLLAGRYRPGLVQAVTAAGECACALAIGVPLAAGWMRIWFLWVIAFAIGCVQTVGLPAGQMFMLDLVGAGELRRGASIASMATGLAKIVGPGLAGFLIAAIGTGPVFLADAGSFLGVIAVLLWLSRTVPAAGDHGRGDTAASRRLRWVLSLPRDILVAAMMALLIGGFGYQFEVTNPLVATRLFHLSPQAFGVLGTLMAAGGIAGSYYSSRRPSPRRSEFVVWALVFGAAECAAAVMPVPWAYEAVMVVIGCMITLFAVTATVYIRQAAGPAQLGPALSAYNAAFIGFVPAGAIVVAAIVALAGVRWALAGPGLAVTAAAAAVLLARAGRPAGERVAEASRTV